MKCQAFALLFGVATTTRGIVTLNSCGEMVRHIIKGTEGEKWLVTQIFHADIKSHPFFDALCLNPRIQYLAYSLGVSLPTMASICSIHG